MYVDTDSEGKIAIHDLTAFEAFIISRVAIIHANVESLYSKDELHFLQKLSHSIDSEIFIHS